jgi:hypothetical protein
MVKAMSGKNVFVFVVCGADEHIATLNFSIKQLKRFSQNKIVVVTDLSRNTASIDHDDIVNIATPVEYDHHQASIFLKTGLHKFLNLENNYCYLDSDVIALSPQVDDIFRHQYGPVTFAQDHCRLNFFSPTAVNCPCSGVFQDRKKRFAETLNAAIEDYDFDKDFNNVQTKLMAQKIEGAISSPLKNLPFLVKLYLRKILPHSFSPQINEELFYSARQKAWLNQSGNIVIHDIMDYYHEIKRSSNFRYNRFKSKWFIKNEGEVFDSKGCSHLIEMIKQKFTITITDTNWQHWNGGVFLFNKDSVDFMVTWHKHALYVFVDKEWKTRDQGALAATVWEFGLQNKKTLPIEFNFIADYHNPKIAYRDGFGFTLDNFKTTIIPNFIHVYHQFGNKDWDIWRGIEKH